MRRWSVIILTMALLGGVEARGAWTDWKPIPRPTDPDDMLMAVDALSPRLFFTGGVQVKMTGGMFPSMKPVLYRSQDGGATVQSIQGNLSGPMGSFVAAIGMESLTSGMVALGGDIWFTRNGGTWQKVALPGIGDGEVGALAALGDGQGVAVGSGGGAWRSTDGGASWTQVSTGTRADLGCLFFRDRLRGWAAGAVVSEQETEEMQTLVSYGDVVVLGTTDGGASWRVLATLPPDSQADGPGGRLACPIFFLEDDRTGFLAMGRYDQEKGRAKEVLLYRTTDGGGSWQDTGTDFQVGTLNMFMKVPIRVSYLAGMFWQDADHGHLVGAADTGLSGSSGGGGGDQPIYRAVDMITLDGGRTWDKTDVGEISFNMGGGTMPQGDPRPLRAKFLDWYTAWLVGEKGNAWWWDYKCIKQSQCLGGYRCEKREGDEHPRCYPVGGAPDGGTGETGGGSDVVGTRDAVEGPEVGSGADLVVLPDGGACQGDCGPGGGSAGGCRAGASGDGLIVLPLVLLGMVWWRSRGSAGFRGRLPQGVGGSQKSP